MLLYLTVVPIQLHSFCNALEWLYVTTESSSMAGGDGAEQCDGELIALRSESQHVATL